MTQPTTHVAAATQSTSAPNSDLPRIEALLARCREAGMAEPFLAALARYLAGQRPIADVLQEWQLAYQQWPILFPDKLAQMRFLPYRKHTLDAGIADTDASEADSHDATTPRVAYELDDLDCRVLDLCNAIGQLSRYFDNLPVGWPIAATQEYLMSRGMSAVEFIGNLSLFTARVGKGVDRQRQFANAIRSYVPTHFSAMLGLLAPGGQWNQLYIMLMDILLDGQPPLVDAAWQVATFAEQNGLTGDLGAAASRLLDADYSRFHDWAIHIADADSPTYNLQRAIAFEALLAHDTPAHIEFAAKLVKESLPNRWASANLQVAALKAIYAYDAATYWPLIAWAATAPQLGKTVLTLLTRPTPTRLEQSRVVLQSIVERGEIDAARQALLLLVSSGAYDWPGRFDFALAQLGHRSKHIREAAFEWLAQHGVAIFDRVAPMLVAKRADARLSAVHALTTLDPARARSLYAVRMSSEKSQRVRQAMSEVVSAIVEGGASV